MWEFFERINAVMARWSVLLSTGVVAMPAQQAQARYQAPSFLTLNVKVTFEYPAEIQKGDTFPVYVRINNNSGRFIQAPKLSYVLLRSDSGLFYKSDFSRLNSLLARPRMIAPRSSMLLHLGDVHTSEPGLTESQVVYGDSRLIGYTAEQQLYAINVKDELPIVIKPSPGIPASGIPVMHAIKAH